MLTAILGAGNVGWTRHFVLSSGRDVVLLLWPEWTDLHVAVLRPTHVKRRPVMNRSETLRALEWVDQAARDGDAERLAKAKLVLQDELASKKSSNAPDVAYRIAFESFVRKTRS